MRSEIKLKVRWNAPEDPELAASSLASGLARILRPEVFKLSQDANAALLNARKIVALEAKPDLDQVLRRKQELEAELAVLQAQLESQSQGM